MKTIAVSIICWFPVQVWVVPPNIFIKSILTIMQTTCTRCNGTGYASAAKDSGTENMHLLHQQIGVYKCTTCSGSGKLGFSEEDIEALNKIASNLLTK